MVTLHAAAGLSVDIGADATVRVAWGEPDWLGPGRVTVGGAPVGVTLHGPVEATDDLGAHAAVRLDVAHRPVRADVRAYADHPVAVLRLEATAAIDDLATGDFAAPCVALAFAPHERAPGGVPDGTSAFGHQYTEFALPTATDASLAGWFLYPPRPAVVEPLLLLAPDGRTLLLAPLDAFHDQVIAVPPSRDADHVERGVRCGWHGDLERVPAGFATELALVAGRGARECLDTWAGIVRARHGTQRLGRDADALGTRLSYWTDNGSAYWYRTEPGHDTPGTLEATIDDLRARGVPVHAVQLDSWWYPHDVIRPFDTDAWEVPPTGLVRWEPRDDVLPDGVPALRARLGDPPLVAHIRHFAASSPYFEGHDAWRDGDRAHPTGPALYERLLDDATAWGVETFEHDWLVECFLGVRGLRAEPGRAARWQEDLDAALATRGLTAQWCMASPADMCETARLRRVTSIRTSGDHGYLLGPGVLWTWFLLTNGLARALGLFPYKDVFRSDGEGGSAVVEAEALLAALSAGPVGIGDPLGRADPALVARTCRADGVLVRPDVPVAAIDRCFRSHPIGRRTLVVGSAHSHHAAGRVGYVVAMNPHDAGDPITERVTRADLGGDAPAGPAVVYDWRTGDISPLGDDPDAGVDVTLGPLGWRLLVVAPVLPSGVAVIGDPTKYATAGDARIAAIGPTATGARIAVLGAGERVMVAAWRDGRRVDTPVDVPASGRATVDV